jgi:hypothetical protein
MNKIFAVSGGNLVVNFVENKPGLKDLKGCGARGPFGCQSWKRAAGGNLKKEKQMAGHSKPLEKKPRKNTQ